MGQKSRMEQAARSSAKASKEVLTAANEPPPRPRVEGPAFEAILASWGEAPRTVARTIFDKHGLPNEATETRLVWDDTRPFKRTIVHRDPLDHDVEEPHGDVLEQFLDYRVPSEKVEDIASFDERIVVDQAQGEVSVRCDQQPMNFLSLNLMHEIVVGHMDVKKARRTYAENAAGLATSHPAPYAERLLFEPVREAPSAQPAREINRRAR